MIHLTLLKNLCSASTVKGLRWGRGACLLRASRLLLNPKQILHLLSGAKKDPLRLLKFNARPSIPVRAQGLKAVGLPLSSFSLPPPAWYGNRRCDDKICWRGHHADSATCSALHHPASTCVKHGHTLQILALRTWFASTSWRQGNRGLTLQVCARQHSPPP